jgi:RNA polymerase sigma-70 factor (ECF subfamily)
MEDIPAMEALYRRYGPMVVRRCRQLLKDEQEAQDAAQDVFLKVLDEPKLMKAEFPSSLLYTIATRHCLNRLRDARRHNSESGDTVLEELAAHDDLESQSFAGRLLDKLFSRHPADTRVMAVMHHVDGMTLEEVARETSFSVSGVRKRLRQLQTTLKSWEQETHGRPQIT